MTMPLAGLIIFLFCRYGVAYRDKDSLSLKITTYYEDHYSVVRANGPMTNEGIFDQFKIVICSAEVSTLSYFEIGVYHQLQPNENGNGGVTENSLGLSPRH